MINNCSKQSRVVNSGATGLKLTTFQPDAEVHHQLTHLSVLGSSDPLWNISVKNESGGLAIFADFPPKLIGYHSNIFWTITKLLSDVNQSWKCGENCSRTLWDNWVPRGTAAEHIVCSAGRPCRLNKQNTKAICNGKCDDEPRPTLTVAIRTIINPVKTPCHNSEFYFQIIIYMKFTHIIKLLGLQCLGGRKSIRPIKNQRWDASMVICLGRGAEFAYGPADATAIHYVLLQ